MSRRCTECHNAMPDGKKMHRYVGDDGMGTYYNVLMCNSCAHTVTTQYNNTFMCTRCENLIDGNNWPEDWMPRSFTRDEWESIKHGVGIEDKNAEKFWTETETPDLACIECRSSSQTK